MTDLAAVYEGLIRAAAERRFDEAIAASALADAPPRLHPLNFVAIRTSEPNGTALRLHIWNEGFRFGQVGFEVHDHSFDFQSFVVSGCVEQCLYEAEADEAGGHDVFTVRYCGSASVLEPRRERTGLRLVERRTFREGDRYRLEHGRLHSLALRSRRAVTLVLSTQGGNSPLSIGPYGSEALRSPRPPVLDDEGEPLTLRRNGIVGIVAGAIEVPPQ